MKFNAFVPAVAAPLLLRALLKPSFRKHLGAVALVPVLGCLVALPAAAQSSFFGSGEAGVEAQAFGVTLALPTVTTVRSGALGVGTVESRNYAFLDGAAGSMNSLAETTSLAGVGGLHLSARARVEIIKTPRSPWGGPMPWPWAHSMIAFSSTCLATRRVPCSP